MNDLTGASSFAIRSETCPVQVQAFFRTSAEYLGLTPDAHGGCLAATPDMPVTGYRDHFAPTHIPENHV